MFVTNLAARTLEIPDETAPGGIRQVRLFQKIGGNKDSQQMVAAVKLGEHWSMFGGLDHRKGEPWDFEVGVTWWVR